MTAASCSSVGSCPRIAVSYTTLSLAPVCRVTAEEADPFLKRHVLSVDPQRHVNVADRCRRPADQAAWMVSMGSSRVTGSVVVTVFGDKEREGDVSVCASQLLSTPSPARSGSSTV